MSTDADRPKPSLVQLRELASALTQFLWHDQRTSYPPPWAQERHLLPGFVRVVDALRPLRPLKPTDDWPDWLERFIFELATTFDVLAYSWGWGELLKPKEARDAFITRSYDRFRDLYLTPIHEAAKECRKNFTAIRCPPFIYELCTKIPAIEYDLVRFSDDFSGLESVWEAVRRKREAFLFGESYPTLSGAGGNPEEFATDVILGDTLKHAERTLVGLVADAQKQFRHICDAVDPKAVRLLAAAAGKELPRIKPDERGAAHVPTEWMVSLTGQPVAVDIRNCEIWGNTRQDDLIRTPDGRFALGRWSGDERRYAVSPPANYRLREIPRREAIAWCNAHGYIYPPDLIPAPESADQRDSVAKTDYPGQDDNLAPYKLDDQPWYGSLPTCSDSSSQDLLVLASQIELVLLTATEIELAAALRLLKPLPGQPVILKGFVEQETYYLGMFGSVAAAVTKCRMGSVGSGSAQLSTDHAIRIWTPSAIIMAGIAFGKDRSKQMIGDVLVASEVFPYEPQRKGATESIPRGVSLPANPTLLNRFENVPLWSFLRPDGSRCRKYVGPLLSGEKLVDDPDFKASLFDPYPSAIGGEMEGAGLASTAERHRVPWILAKAICDWADGSKNGIHQPLATAAAMSLVHYVLLAPDVLHGLQKKPR